MAAPVHRHVHRHAHHGKPARPIHYVLLPQVGGNGYYSYTTMDKQYGTQKTVDAIVEVCRQWMMPNPTAPVGLGDMAYRGGAPMAPHHSHRDGKEIDIRPVRTDRKSAPTNIHDPTYDRQATSVLVALLLAHPNVHTILFNDSAIKGVKHWAGHDNHLHVKMKG